MQKPNIFRHQQCEAQKELSFSFLRASSGLVEGHIIWVEDVQDGTGFSMCPRVVPSLAALGRLVPLYWGS